MQRQIPILPTIVVVAAAAIMVMLGFWQLGRADEKEALIAQYEAAQARPSYAPMPYDLPEAAYGPAMANCVSVEEIRTVAGRNVDNQAGFAHVARCLDGGQWPDMYPEDGVIDIEPTPVDVVIGWSRSPQAPEWVGGAVSGTVVPSGELGYKIVADPPLAGLEANARPDPQDLPNNHLAYAGQWFFFAITALVIYWLAIRRRWRDQAKASSADAQQ